MGPHHLIGFYTVYMGHWSQAGAHWPLYWPAAPFKRDTNMYLSTTYSIQQRSSAGNVFQYIYKFPSFLHSFHLHKVRPCLCTSNLTHLLSSCHLPSFFPFTYTTYVLSFVLFTFTHSLRSCYFPLVILSPLVSTVHVLYSVHIAFIILSTVRTYSLLPPFVHSIYKFFLFFFYLL